MKAIIMSATGPMITQLPKPKPLRNEVLVKIEWASVCGSDYPFLNGKSDRTHLIGHVMGHEGCGMIVGVGSGVHGFEKGEKVAFESHRARRKWISEGNDPYKDPLCAIIGYRGFPNGDIPQGTWAEYLVVPGMYAHKIPPELYSSFPGSLWEPMGNSIRVSSVVHELFTNASGKIVVSGCGPQGIMALMILKHFYGFESLFAVDISRARLGIVESLGLARTFVPDQVGNLAPRLWIEMSGAVSAFHQALSTVVPNGTVILFGLPHGSGIKIKGVPYKEFVLQGRKTKLQGKQLIGVVGRYKKDWEEASEILRIVSQKANLSRLYSHFGPLDNLPSLVEEKEIPPRDESVLKAVFSAFT